MGVFGPREPVVRTVCGKVRGAPDDRGILVFRGIPFAASTAGANRFQPPRPPAAWEGVRMAEAAGPIAPQNAPELGLSRLPPASEDCLNLNVFTPSADRGRRPVLVYLHAGAFVSGTGSGATQDGSQLARDEDVVVVTVNYRLGVLGFPPFRPGGQGPSNLGLLDQVAALQWVRANIARFGGDPRNVTLFGYSAGGWSIVALMTAPQAAGLFHKAAPQSGSEFTASPPAEQAALARAFCAFAGVAETDVAALQALPLDRLLAAQQALLESRQNAAGRQIEEGIVFGPRLDGVVLAEDPFRMALAGRIAPLPMLIGTTADELGYTPFRAAIGWLDAMHAREAALRSLAAAYGEDRAQRIWQAYTHYFPGHDDAQIAGHIRSDRYYRLPAIRVAEAQRAPTWMYQFTLPAPSQAAGGVSTHATDLPFWFGTMAASPLQPFLFGRDPSRAELALSRRMRRDLAGFARTGRCDWAGYGTRNRATKLYGENDEIAFDPQASLRRAWPAT